MLQRAVLADGRASREKCAAHTLNKGSQTALITRLAVSLCLDFPDAGRVAPISACVFSQRLSDRANLNPKVELKTFPLARAHFGTCTAYLCNVNKNSSPPPLRLRTDMSPW